MSDLKEFLKRHVSLIGLSGAAGSGKDYLAREYFKKEHGFRNISFAWPFKVQLFAQGVGTYDEIFHTKPEKIRTVLQVAGTELGRMKYGEDVWVNQTLAWIRHLYEEWMITRFIIPDVRFPNEAVAIREAGGRVYRVISDVPNRADNGIKDHASETSLTDRSKGYYYGTIYNYIENPRDPKLTEDLINRIVEEIVF